MTDFATDPSPLAIPDDVTIPQFLFDSSHQFQIPREPNATCLIDDATGYSVGFEQLRDRIAALANALSIRYGIGEDDVVCICSPNHIDFPTAIWAIQRLGGIVTCSNPAFGPTELVFQHRITKPKLLIVDPSVLPANLAAAKDVGLDADRIVLLDIITAEGLQPPPDVDTVHSSVEALVSLGSKSEVSFEEPRLKKGEGRTKLGFLCFSSGTTGLPKAVMLPHYAVIANMIQMAMQGRRSPGLYQVGDVSMGVMPMYFVGGCIGVLHQALFAGQALVLIRKFSFLQFLEGLARYRTTHMIIVPPIAILLITRPEVKNYDLGRIRLALCGGAALSQEQTARMSAVLPSAIFAQGYGMTEAAPTITYPNLNEFHPPKGSVGLVLPGSTCRILLDNGSFGKVGDLGEVIVKSPSLALGYLNDEEATKAAFRDGWLHTGDSGYFDKDGYFYFVGRFKELIKVRGISVAPAEIEGCVYEHPDVAGVCVVGIPNEYSGEVPRAVIELKADAKERIQSGGTAEEESTKAALVKHVEERQAKYKWLAGGVQLVDKLPRNPTSGKIMRKELQERVKADALREANGIKA